MVAVPHKVPRGQGRVGRHQALRGALLQINNLGGHDRGVVGRVNFGRFGDPDLGRRRHEPHVEQARGRRVRRALGVGGNGASVGPIGGRDERELRAGLGDGAAVVQADSRHEHGFSVVCTLMGHAQLDRVVRLKRMQRITDCERAHTGRHGAELHAIVRLILRYDQLLCVATVASLFPPFKIGSHSELRRGRR